MIEVVSGVVSIVEGVQRALAPRVHDAFGALVYDTVRSGVRAGGTMAGSIARVVGVSLPVTTVVESGVVQRAVGGANARVPGVARSRGP
ncbi:MAG: hypothetical protein GEV28_16265 [Actinophytocola sp.]|uniref:hypothetical protein n=1 Tax=Actinophytocola sp. TaxID=1872138 RepID=UPI00132A2563|nr:hypothetical protein [Actinophytocola sp.]MPZ81858.1 hypothetical protein [Actinophytocola sp.]